MLLLALPKVDVTFACYHGLHNDGFRNRGEEKDEPIDFNRYFILHYDDSFEYSLYLSLDSSLDTIRPIESGRGNKEKCPMI
ncbi:MAG: hypothetical protein KF770_31125 [Anaerolineae bacterium]|nr:hypothetical protein [Anaerolineae bacterium]